MHHLTRRGVSGSRLDRNRYARQLRSFTEIYLSKALGLARQAAIVFLRLYKVFQGEHRSREDEIDVKFEGIDTSPKGKGIIEFALEGIQDYWMKLN